MKSNFSSWVEGFVPLAIGAKDADAVAEFGGSLGGMKPEIAISAATTVFLSDHRNVLHRVGVNTTIIQSKTDMVVPESVAYYIKGRIRAPANVAILKTQGHFPRLTVPSLLLPVVKKALGIND